MFGGGEIHITFVSAFDKMGIAVLDHGIGMTQQQLLNIGKRFWRADYSGKTPGTGLGMAIGKEIMALQGCQIDIQSKIHEGTTVTLWWPVAGHPA